jgi:hypothetical protein
MWALDLLERDPHRPEPGVPIDLTTVIGVDLVEPDLS